MKKSTRITAGLVAGAIAVTAFAGTALAGPSSSAAATHGAFAVRTHRHHAGGAHAYIWMLPSGDASATIPATATIPGYGWMVSGAGGALVTAPATGTLSDLGWMTDGSSNASAAPNGAGPVVPPSPAPAHGLMSNSF